MVKRKLPKNVRERNGKYYYRYDITDPATGKRKQKETKGYATPREAERAGIRIQAELLQGTYIEEQNIMFGDWCDKWLVIYASTGKVKKRTVDRRADSLKIAKKRLGGLKLRDITKLQYQAFLHDLKNEDGYAQNTVRAVHDVVSMAVEKALELEIIGSEFTKGAELPNYQKTVFELENEEELPEYLEKEELALLLRTAQESGDIQGYHMLTVLAYTGMRVGELCALKTSDINELKKNISITKTLNDDGPTESFEITTPKTKSSIRKVDYGDKVSVILKAQLAWRKEYRMSENHRFYTKEEFVFVNCDMFPGHPLHTRSVERFLKRMLEKAQLPLTITPHSLRHTYTSLMAEAGVELPSIQRLLGHKNDNITRDIYLHVTKAKKKEAVEKLDKLMGNIQ